VINMGGVKYCPQCGAELTGETAVVELMANDGHLDYDIYCDRCGWSGIISPDR